MRYLLSFLIVVSVFSCTSKKGKLSWKADPKNKGYYSCYDGEKVIPGRWPSKDQKCGIVVGNGEVPTEFVFQFDENARIAEIEKKLKDNVPSMKIDSCSCNPRLRIYSDFPVYEVWKSEGLAVKSTGRNGQEVEMNIPNVLGFAPNYSLIQEPRFLERKEEFPKELISDLKAVNGLKQDVSDGLVKVAVFDTGYDPNAGIIQPADLGISCSNFTKTLDDDATHHGTLVTALLLAQVEADKKKNLGIVPVKVLDKNGKGSLFDLVCALSSLKGKKVDIINASLGFYAPKEDSTTARFLAKYIQETGALFFAAAGNANENADREDKTSSRNLSVRNLQFFPACVKGVENMIPVTSCVQQAGKYSVCTTQNFSSEFVRLAVAADNSCKIGLNGTLSFRGQGSSFAAPVAAGKVAALLIGASGGTPPLLPVLLSTISQQIPPGNWSVQNQVESNRIVIP